MKVLNGLDGLYKLPPGSATTIGNYDGVHVGHAAIVIRLHEAAPGRTAVVTFEPHPLTALRPDSAPPRLTTVLRKRELLAELGVDYLVELPPTAEVLGLSAEQFWRMIRHDIRPAYLVEGPIFNFGKGRSGNIDQLRAWAADSRVKLVVEQATTVALLDGTVATVSSTLIRRLLTEGRVADAARCLDRFYKVCGEVVKGFQRGRQIGVPTANVKSVNQMLPGDGVYAGHCRLDNELFAAAISIGHAPTFELQRHQVEVHLLDFTGDLYGRNIGVDFTQRLRGQYKMSGVDELKKQLAVDIDAAREAHRQQRLSSPAAVNSGLKSAVDVEN